MKIQLVLLVLFTIIALVQGAILNKKHYIVYMGERSHQNVDSVIRANHETLASVTGSFDEAQEASVHHYSKSFRGFSAMLTEEQAQKLAENDSIVSIFESRLNELHTTHSWDFLGVNSVNESSQAPMASLSSDIIVGVIDSGVWPDSASFNDKDLGPVPSKFKGACVTGENFTSANCNRKIIGARYYFKGFEAELGPLDGANRMFFRSARDSDGHGTHTASTIAGSVVPDVSVYGIARGTARGGAPNARLAIYKACWFDFCSDADVLAAMDDAISDGVDILSLSLGPSPPQPSFFKHPIAIGAFHAFKSGVFVACSAGNSFFPGTATNVAPWILTVAASSLDRKFNTNIYLGNSNLKPVVQGSSINPLAMEASYGLIAASDAAAPGVSAQNASSCRNHTLDETKIKGKIVVCKLASLFDDRRRKAAVVQQGGGVGMILVDPNGKDVAIQFVIPAASIGQKEAEQLQAYVNMQQNPVARIAPTQTALNARPAPEMAIFSSQGPNVITPDIIKPDVTAPGLNILAAWSPVATDTTGGRSIDYNILSGTSMSCPHVAGIAAILKSYHSYWSPAAIMSAIMTTATIFDNTGKVIDRQPNATSTTPFDYGSGHVNPVTALDPGLVYEFNTSDIINFLCANGANPAALKNLTGQVTYCPNPSITSTYFNYPSIGVSNMMGSISLHRTVTYYGKGQANYTATLENPTGVNVTVVPNMLSFKSTGERLSFRLDFVPYATSNGEFVFGSLTWSDGIRKVRSPIGLNVTSLYS